MEIVVSGSTWLIGSALVSSLTAAGHKVVRLVRKSPRPGTSDVLWDPAKAYVDTTKLENKDAVVHLSGESIAERWTPKKKIRIQESRARGTHLLCEALRQLEHPPKVLVSGSAIGYYGDRGDEVLREESPPGSGFLAELCRQWEEATEPAARRGIRVAHLRTGIVLSAKGGALAKMLPPFRMGAGGRIGSGKQYMSWIAMDDHAAAIQHIIENPALQGPVNAVGPNPARNLEFTKTLGKVLSRPAIFPLPAFAVHLAFGQMGQELLLASQRVEPARLKASGFSFRFADLEAALRHVLGR